MVSLQLIIRKFLLRLDFVQFEQSDESAPHLCVINCQLHILLEQRLRLLTIILVLMQFSFYQYAFKWKCLIILFIEFGLESIYRLQFQHLP